MPYSAITVEGGLFPADLLDRIATGDAEGQGAKDFGQPDARRLTDEIQKAFSDLHVYRDSFERQKESSRRPLITLTRETWMTPVLDRLGFDDLNYQRAYLQAGGDGFDISHLAGDSEAAPPVDIVAQNQPLDKRARGARRSPHSAVQEYLNRGDGLWGIVTNGDVTRLLRDSNRVAHPAYVEFDLAAILRDNLYDEFYLLYRLLHRSRFPSASVPAESCLLETYYQKGLEEGGRVRDHLRDGVEEALKVLGSAFLAPENRELREALRSGQRTPLDYYRQLLRLVYRLLFLLVVEERRLLFDTSELETAAADPAVTGTSGTRVVQASDIYSRYYSLSALRRRAGGPIPDDRFVDVWEGMKRVFHVLSGETWASDGRRSWVDPEGVRAANPLGLSPLNGELFGPDACHELEMSSCRNIAFLTAIRHLTTFRDETKIRRAVNFKDLDVEELGSVYESLLEFHPHVDLESAQPFDLVAGSERKQTGSYYTPSSLVRELIKSALEPVIEDRLGGATSEDAVAREAAILSIRVCDPASGSGHFLLAAARRLARELAKVRAGDDEPAPPIFRQALRDVIRQCIYAVDKNPLAVDLCKVALWIEGYNSGLPLSFLDNHVRCGDSLVGVFDLAVLAEGIPDGAYTAVTGDDKSAAAQYKKRNKQERSGQITLGSAGIDPWEVIGRLAPRFEELALREDPVPYETRDKQRTFGSLRSSTDFQTVQRACDLWTAAFFLPLEKAGPDGLEPAVTTATVRGYLGPAGPRTYAWIAAQAQAIGQKHPFFHWPLEFPEVFAAPSNEVEYPDRTDRTPSAGAIRHFRSPGFDVVLGNPPWERIKLQEKEFFAARDPEIAMAANKAARDRLIKSLPDRDPELLDAFEEARHEAEAASRFIRGSLRFPLCGRGDVNTYSVFAEVGTCLVHHAGRVGIILPTGIATDDTTKFFFQDILRRGALESLFGFKNERFLFSRPVEHTVTFCLVTIRGGSHTPHDVEFCWLAWTVEEMRDPDRRYRLSLDDIALVNPNTRTAPIFRTARDAEITKAIYRRVPILVDESKGDEGNPWGISFLAMFHMSNDSHLFRNREELEGEGYRLGTGADGNVFIRGSGRYLPLYEAKMLHQFDHRWATYDGLETRDMTDAEKADPDRLALPRYWVPEAEVQRRLAGRWDRQWLLGWRDICRSTDERTVIATTARATAVGHKFPIAFADGDPRLVACLLGNLDSFALDFTARQKVGGTSMTYFIVKQLPVLSPSHFRVAAPWDPDVLLEEWFRCRVLESTYTAFDMNALGRDLDYEGPPFRWDPVRRFLIRCELDAAFFHLYGIGRDDVDYIMEAFPIVKRKDLVCHRSYRTKDTIIGIYDAMQVAIDAGEQYRTVLDPSPARATVGGLESRAAAFSKRSETLGEGVLDG